jgi:hypothetical protein
VTSVPNVYCHIGNYFCWTDGPNSPDRGYQFVVSGTVSVTVRPFFLHPVVRALHRAEGPPALSLTAGWYYSVPHGSQRTMFLVTNFIMICQFNIPYTRDAYFMEALNCWVIFYMMVIMVQFCCCLGILQISQKTLYFPFSLIFTIFRVLLAVLDGWTDCFWDPACAHLDRLFVAFL